MEFTKIDMDSYPRREHYNHYANILNCTYSLNQRINVKSLIEKAKGENKKFYPLFITIVSHAVNLFSACKMAVDKDGNLGFYDKISPSYLIFHDDDKTFSSIWTEYNDNGEIMYNSIISDMEKYHDRKGFQTKVANAKTFPVSTIPWSDYEALNLNIPYCDNFYAPIFTWGKFDEKGNMTISVQVNHEVMDGYHTCKKKKKIEELCNAI